MEIITNHAGYIYNEKMPDFKQALHSISTHFKEGYIYGVIGTSGSGKSTLIQLFNGLLLPTSGSVQSGEFILEPKRSLPDMKSLRFQVGLVFQQPEEQFFQNTVFEEIAFGMECFQYKLDQKEKHVSDALKMVQLDESYLGRDPLSLSEGEKRKIAIASVLAFNPKVLILDEPTVGLDMRSKKNLIKIIRILKRRYQKTVIIVSHDVDFLHQIVDSIYVLNKGEIVMEGDKYQVFEQVDVLKNYGISVPKVVEFAHLVFVKKGIKMGYRDEINDLIKDIYRYVK